MSYGTVDRLGIRLDRTCHVRRLTRRREWPDTKADEHCRTEKDQDGRANSRHIGINNKGYEGRYVKSN